MESYKESKKITYCKKILFVFLFLLSTIAFAQEEASLAKHSKIDIGVSLQSRYVWRGLLLGGNSPSIQPSVKFTAGKFALGAWGAYSTRGLNEFQEADLYVSYAPTESLSFTITDYFFPKEGVYNNYFEHGNNTGHVYEVLASFNGTKNFPISIILATNFAGAIKYVENESEKKAYSTYIEVSYSKKVVNIVYSLFAGAVFGDYNNYYLTDGSGFINLGLSAIKEIKITENYNLPINAALTFNPEQENIYLTFGCSL